MLVVALAVAVILAVMYVRPIPLDAPALEDDASRMLPAVTMTHFANLRVPIWHVGMFVIYDQPWFGIGGPSRYGPVSADYADFFDRISPYLSSYPEELERQVWRSHAHQGALQVAAQWGMPAMLAAFGFIALLGRHLLKGSQHDVWALGAWGALVALVVHNMLDYTVIYLAAEAGLLLGIGAGWSAGQGGDAAPE
jgi:O-antigen ligase